MSTPPIPTIGRIVLFCGDDGQDRPAIVTHVWSPFCVNLQVFPKDSSDGNNCGSRTSVTHAGPETNEKATPGTWHWMPYQIQTAGTRHQDAPAKPSTVEDAIAAELARAVAKYPTWPTDPLHALAVLGEEFGELTKAMLQLTYEAHKTNLDEVRTEAIQTAAMAIRLAKSLDTYTYCKSPQHQQA